MYHQGNVRKPQWVKCKGLGTPSRGFSLLWETETWQCDPTPWLRQMDWLVDSWVNRSQSHFLPTWHLFYRVVRSQAQSGAMAVTWGGGRSPATVRSLDNPQVFHFLSLGYLTFLWAMTFPSIPKKKKKTIPLLLKSARTDFCYLKTNKQTNLFISVHEIALFKLFYITLICKLFWKKKNWFLSFWNISKKNLTMSKELWFSIISINVKDMLVKKEKKSCLGKVCHNLKNSAFEECLPLFAIRVSVWKAQQREYSQ